MKVKLNTLPATLAEFQALPRSTPEEVCSGFLCALNLYTKSPNAVSYTHLDVYKRQGGRGHRHLHRRGYRQGDR